MNGEDHSVRAAEALACAAHLACVRGPDLGVVIPLREGLVLGREGEVPLTAPSLSRRHLHVLPNPQTGTPSGGRGRGRGLARVSDAGSTNGTRVRSGRGPLCLRRRLRPGRAVSLRAGQVLVMGEDWFLLRERPRDLAWHGPDPAPTARRRLPGTLVLLLPLALFGGWRIWALTSGQNAPWVGPLLLGLAVLAAVVCLIWFWRRRRRHRARWGVRDAAALALTLASRAAHTPGALQTPHPARDAGGARTGKQDLAGWSAVAGPRAPVLRTSLTGRPGFAGPGALAAARWWIGQVAATTGGATVHVGGHVGEGPSRWLLGDGSAKVHLLTRDDPLPSGPGAGADTHMVGVAPEAAQLPPWCDTVVDAPEDPVCQTWWWQCVRAAEDSSTLPTQVDALELWERSTAPRRGLGTVLGVDARGPLALDLVEDGPHALVAGTTGAGKSVALTTWLLGMCREHGPDRVRLVLVDYKGGAAFGPLVDLPHVEAVLTDLDEAASERALRGLETHLRRREALLREAGVADLSGWEALPDSPALPRVVVVIDEFRVLAQAHPGVMEALTRLAVQGRSLGMHLVAATQRPAGAITAQMKANMELRVALRCLDAAESLDVLGNTVAASLPRIPGRAVIPAVAPGRGEVQIGHVADPGALVTSIAHRWRRAAIESSPLWIPPLPLQLQWSQLPAGALALVEDLEAGTHSPLQWSGGHVRVEGPRALAGELARAATALASRIAAQQELPLHGVLLQGRMEVDSCPDLLLSSLVRPTVAEGVGDFACLVEEIAEHGPGVLLIDDLPGAIAALERRLGPAARDLVAAVLARPREEGLVVVAGTPGGLGAELGSAFAQRLVTATSADELLRLGVARAPVPPDVPGRFLTGASRLRECQVPIAPCPAGMEGVWGVRPTVPHSDHSVCIGAEWSPVSARELAPTTLASPLEVLTDDPQWMVGVLERWCASSGVELALDEGGGEAGDTALHVRLRPGDHWSRMRLNTRSVALVHDPGPEVMRILQQVSIHSSLAVRAQPRGRNCAVFLHSGVLHRARLHMSPLPGK
ncbi:FHA domain-containing protein [Schaalia sp. 19OD2882]|uniref:FtsK/SpoIIIE domain-containing protein n=1 Tax=Schaalia sp. 19OD2882 TaxID=2794089 RepID=UPI001C1EED2E|nr:FtsK/SpoIIIE domain-containing protein [Schaalia sp. 19OD2882]QWW19132.1 FHA domain-containing protein [Schaalia sp. 19OD2882]